MEKLVLIFALVHFYYFIAHFLKLLKVVKLKEKLSEHIEKYVENKDMKAFRNNVIKLKPAIKDLVSFWYTSNLNYDSSDVYFGNDLKSITSELNDIHNQLIFDFRKVFNPITTLKNLILIPSIILDFFNITTSNFSKFLFTILSWMFLAVNYIYNDEIKLVIKEFFRLIAQVLN